jgi:hypothetical protein
MGWDPTNPGDAQAIEKEFLVSTTQLGHGLYPCLMGPWNCLHPARAEHEILDMNTLRSPNSSIRLTSRGFLQKCYSNISGKNIKILQNIIHCNNIFFIIFFKCVFFNFIRLSRSHYPCHEFNKFTRVVFL